MSLKTRLSSLLFAPPSHTEPLGQLDVWDRSQPTEDFASESRAEVSTPKAGA